MNLKKIPILILITGLSWTLASCTFFSGKKSTKDESGKEKPDLSLCGNIKYARGFQIVLKNDYKELTVFDPWNRGKVFYKYYLISREKQIPTNLPEDGTIIRVPVKSVAVFSSPQIGVLKYLNEQGKIVTVSHINRLFDEMLTGKAKEGNIAEVGDIQSLNFEKLIEASPELVMVSGFMKISDEENKLMQAGLPVMYTIEWMEDSPLARAEWIKFCAAFFDKEKEAEHFFAEIEKRYLDLIKNVERIEDTPNILAGYNFKGTWYMPGGRSYMAGFLRHGRANYYWNNDTTKGSIPLSFEVVYDKQGDADIWFLPAECSRLEELKNLDTRYALFKPFKTGKVYSHTKRMTGSGANDWWETSMVRPDVVLKDVIKILHPELLPGYEMYYYQQLK